MKVVENSKKYIEDFIRLNEQWITHYFEIEEVDRKLAENPYSIVEKGGYIFTLVVDGRVKGVCALFNNGEGVFELARMAVSTESRGLGYGATLMDTMLDKLKYLGASKVYLVSNTKLSSAISLYKKYGFRVVSEGQHPVYSRANIVMEKSVVQPKSLKEE